ncbi:MAG: preprotein translocase subunit SecE [Eubacterium sp.]|nr:preprotein translocase subunit SecE [Eubacterium sp.]
MSDKTEKKENASPALKRSWFQGLKVEAKKITWPDKKRVARETTAVVISAVVLGAITMGIDFLVEYGLSYIW